MSSETAQLSPLPSHPRVVDSPLDLIGDTPIIEICLDEMVR
jgi:cysteine synthase A